MTKTLDTAYVHYELQDDVLIGTYKKGLKINLDIAKEIVKTRLEFIDFKPKLTLALNQGVISMTKEARDYLADEGIQGVLAGAIVLDSPVGSFIGNFYLLVSKPKVPARIFTKKEDAIKWLSKFRETIPNNG